MPLALPHHIIVKNSTKVGSVVVVEVFKVNLVNNMIICSELVITQVSYLLCDNGVGVSLSVLLLCF